MDRLPRDIANERRHSDIVRLLDEHIPHSPQMLGGMTHNTSSSMIGTSTRFPGTSDVEFSHLKLTTNLFTGSPHHLMNHSTLLGSTKIANKSKKRPKSSVGGNSPSSPPEQDTPQTLRRKTSAKKIPKKQTLENHDTTLLGLDAANLYGSSALPQMPYDDRMQNAVSLQNLGIDFQQPYTFPVFQEPSPPHSVTFSPPAKTRPSLPTSPTHIAAMRTATQQKHPSMHYTDPFNLNTNMQSNPTYQQTNIPQPQPPQPPPQQQSQYYHHFLTPPSEPSERNSFPTPSPESSPYYWSSSSPHSNSDWSEGILSPNSSSQGNKQSEAIFI